MREPRRRGKASGAEMVGVARAAKIGCVVVLVAVTLAGGVVARDQWTANKAEKSLREMIRLDRADDASVARIHAMGRDCLLACGSRVDMAAAAALVVRGQKESDPEIRRTVLARAEGQLSEIVRRDPGLGEVWIWQARNQILTGRGDPLQSLQRSYQVQPFDRTHALWRLSVINERWGEAPAALRIRALDEAFWYGSVFPPFARTVTAVMSNPAANLALTLRRKARVGDDQSPDHNPIP